MKLSANTLCDIITALSEAGESDTIIAVADRHITLSRRQLLDNCTRLAGGIAASGIQPGDVVALLADNSELWITTALAIILRGAVVLPIDTQVSDTNLGHALEDSGAALVFTSEEQEQRLESLALPTRPRTVLIDDRDRPPWQALTGDDGFSPPDRDPDDLAVLFYTSGTTGPPKGVPLSHGNIAFQLQSIASAGLIAESDRILLPLPLHHVYPFVMGMLAPLALALPIILPLSLTGPEILRAIREGRATTVIGVPRLYRALHDGISAQAAHRGRLAGALFNTLLAVSIGLRRYTGIAAGKKLLRPVHRQFGPGLRLLASGGSALDPELGRRLKGFGWEVGIGYGLTETSPLLTLNPPDSRAPASVGQPIAGVEIKIDPDAIPDNTESGEGQRRGHRVGEVLARGPSVFRGYWHLPDKTREAFTDDGWYRTGDLGYLDGGGYLYLQGRASTLIVTESGKNIQPDEVEAVYADHPAIAEAGVLEREGRLVAVIVPDGDGIGRKDQDEAEAIATAVREQSKKLPSYQRLGDYSLSREALPRTRLGKIQRHLLDKHYDRARGADKPEDNPGPIAADEMSDRDRALLDDTGARKVWQWLGERYADRRLTPDTSLAMDLQIDSMEMVSLSLEISQLTGVELGEQAIAGIETVRDLLRQVAEPTGDSGGLDPGRIMTEPDIFLSDEQRRSLRPHTRFQSLVAAVAHFSMRVIMALLFRLRVQGLENLPPERPFVLAPNHTSVLDPVALFAAIPRSRLRDTCFAGWTGMIFKNRLLRFAGRIGRTVPIDPRHAAASSLALGAMVLKADTNLIWFPEGERSRTGKLLPFKSGIGLLLEHYQVPIVPVAITGTYEAMPTGKRLPRLFRPVTVTFGEPVYPGELTDSGSGEPAHQQISRGLHDRVKSLLCDNGS